jgi:hypothetical protein
MVLSAFCSTAFLVLVMFTASISFSLLPVSFLVFLEQSRFDLEIMQRLEE